MRGLRYPPKEGVDDRAYPRYTPHWFAKEVSYDVNHRVTSFTSGADVSEFMGSGGESRVWLEYDNRGRMRRMMSSYGTLVSDTVVRDDGRLSSILYGDVAQTRTELQYNDTRADAPVSRMTVRRNARPAAWDQPGYPAEDALAPTQQLVLTDTAFEYDGVANPTAITDSSPAAWALGAASRTRTVVYDDMHTEDMAGALKGTGQWGQGVTAQALRCNRVNSPRFSGSVQFHMNGAKAGAPWLP